MLENEDERAAPGRTGSRLDERAGVLDPAVRMRVNLTTLTLPDSEHIIYIKVVVMKSG